MTRAKTALFIIIAMVIGVVLAMVAYFAFFVGPASWLNLFVWAGVGLAIGATTATWSKALATNALIGFTLVFSYSLLGYRGSGPIVNATPLFAAIALIGAIGMAAAGALGHLVRLMGQRRREVKTNP